MLDVSLNTVKNDLVNNLIKITLFYPMTKHEHFKLLKAINIKLSNGFKILIPEGFVFDGSSAPKFLWWLFPSYGDFFMAALIHDFLYQQQFGVENMGLKEAQKFADKEMLIWSNVVHCETTLDKIDNYLRYYAVRLFGKKVFRK